MAQRRIEHFYTNSVGWERCGRVGVHTSSISSNGCSKTCLVIDDAPGVGHHLIVVLGKGMVAGPGSADAVAHYFHVLLAASLQPLANVIGCQCGKRTAQRMPYESLTKIH